MFDHIEGSNPVIIVEGATDRIFIERMRQVRPFFLPDYLQLGGVDKLKETFALLLKADLFKTIPAIKVIVDDDGDKGRPGSISQLLNIRVDQMGQLVQVDRSSFGVQFNNTPEIGVGGYLVKGLQYNDLEGLILDSDSESVVNCFNDACTCVGSDANAPGKRNSKRLRMFSRSVSSENLKENSYHDLYGSGSGIDFRSSVFTELHDFLDLQ